jgi:hypothetical protein
MEPSGPARRLVQAGNEAQFTQLPFMQQMDYSDKAHPFHE